MSEVVLGYATREKRRWSRLALIGLAWSALTHALVSYWVVRLLAKLKVVGDHFLCCDHPNAGFMLLVVVPLAGALMGVLAGVQIRRDRTRLRGLWVAVGAVVVGLVGGVLGFCALMGLRA